MNFGLLGRSLSHSYSPQIHSQLGDYTYTCIEQEPENIPQFMQTTTLAGFNVTIPYKKAVIPYCNKLSSQARRLGAVNTVVKDKDDNWIGHNTDYFGFDYMLRKSGLQLSGKKVLVLGSGGASVTAVAVLQAHGAHTIVISRDGENNYQNIHNHSDASVIVNATPVGMYPNVGISPVCLDDFPNLEGVLDLIYNPARTELLLQAEDRGLIANNGLSMLVAQAKESAEWFTGKALDNCVIEVIHKKLQKQMQNIVLIGMPGSGKSTIGQMLAEATGKRFVDADVCIVERAGKSILEIFSADGETGFREIETHVLSDLGKESSLIIATGGGCVTRPENYRALHQNGTIVWLDRNLEKLPTEGRPLSQSGRLEELYQKRLPLYQRFADHCVENNGEKLKTIDKLIRLLELEVI